jgi:hypothetical protein
MKHDKWIGLLVLWALLAACSGAPERPPVPEQVPVSEPFTSRPRPTSAEEVPLRAMLAYYTNQTRVSAPPPRDRAPPADPYLQMQQAIQHGQARPPDLQRAISLLERTMKSAHPAAVNLQPLARLLHEQYGERLRLEQQVREAQRRGDLLQEKIDALTAIERSLATPSTQGQQESAR